MGWSVRFQAEVNHLIIVAQSDIYHFEISLTDMSSSEIRDYVDNRSTLHALTSSLVVVVLLFRGTVGRVGGGECN